jgi:hypothetical protein
MLICLEVHESVFKLKFNLSKQIYPLINKVFHYFNMKKFIFLPEILYLRMKITKDLSCNVKKII